MAEINNVRCAPINATQKEVLLKYLKKNPELQTGNFTPTFTKKKAAELWQEITNLLNNIPNGAKKEWKQWRKTWQDQKKFTKSKLSKNKASASQTGGGSSKEIVLNEYENEVAAFINKPTVEGDPLIEESEAIFELPLVETKNDQELIDLYHINQTISITPEIQDEQNLLNTTIPSTTKPPSRYCFNTCKKNTNIIRTRRKYKSTDTASKLIAGASMKNTIMQNYYRHKLRAMKLLAVRRRIYENEKLKLLKERNSIEKNILDELKNITKMICK